jgi:hypothetical protein
MTDYEIDPKLSAASTSHEMWSPAVERIWQFCRPLKRPAACGAVSAALIIGIVLYYNQVQSFASNSGNSSFIAGIWITVFGASCVLLSLLIGVGLPYLLTYKRGYQETFLIMLFESAILLIALLISGPILFQSQQASVPQPVRISCGRGTAAQICMEPQVPLN